MELRITTEERGEPSFGSQYKSGCCGTPKPRTGEETGIDETGGAEGDPRPVQTEG